MLGNKGGAVPIVPLECCSLSSPRSRRQYCVLSHPNPYAPAESPFVGARHASPLSHTYQCRRRGDACVAPTKNHPIEASLASTKDTLPPTASRSTAVSLRTARRP